MNTSTIHYPTKTKPARLEINGESFEVPAEHFDTLMREQGVLTRERAVEILHLNK